jgi:preprotein translocase subunit YajC
VSPIVLAAPASNGNALTLPLVYVAIFALFYFLFIRPQRRRQRALQAEQSTVAVGSEVMTSSGVYGRIVAENEDDTVLLEIAPGVPIRIARKAIARTVTPAIPEVDNSPDDEPPAST